jgi:hypothetical protein
MNKRDDRRGEDTEMNIKLHIDNRKSSVSRTTPFPTEGWGARFNFGGCLVLHKGLTTPKWCGRFSLCYCYGFSSLLERRWGEKRKEYHRVSEIKFAVVSLSLLYSIQQEFLFIHLFPISDVFSLLPPLNLS